MLSHDDLVRALDVDHPDRVVADEGDAAAVGGPLRIRRRLLGGGELLRVAAPSRHEEDLTGAGGFGRERHSAAVG